MKVPAPFELISLDEYHESFEERLAREQMSETGMYTFMGLARGMATQAFTAIVSLDSIHNNRLTTLARLQFVDQDFRPIRLLDAHVDESILHPTEREAVVLGWGFGRCALQEAYLMGYDDGIEDAPDEDVVDEPDGLSESDRRNMLGVIPALTGMHK